MTVKSFTEKRHEPRYQIVHDQSVEVLVQCQTGESDESIRGELRNLSAGGVQILLPVHPKFGSSQVGLRIHMPDAKVNIDAGAEVCWIRPVEDDKCLIGCSFAIRLSESVLDRLAVAGIIDRRRHPRQLVSIPGIARWESDTDSFPVRITDCSEGGFCMASGRPGTVGGPVSIELNALDDLIPTVSGRVCWQDERDGEYFLGCSLDRGEDFQQLRRFFCVSGAPRRTAPRFFRRQTSVTLLRAAALAFLFVGSAAAGLIAIDSWRRTSADVGSADAERNSVALAAALETGSAAVVVNQRSNRSEPIQLRVGAHQMDADLLVTGRHATQETTPQELNFVLDTSSGDTIGIQLGGDIALSQRVETGMQPPVGTHDKLPAPDAEPRVQSAWPGMRNADLSGSVPDVERPNRTRADQDDSDEMWVSGSVGVDRIPRHNPTPFHVGGENKDASLDMKTLVPAKGAPQVDNDDHHNSVSEGLRGSRVAITKAKEAFIVGAGFYRTSRYDQAIRAFQTAVENDSRNALYYYLLAMTHYQLGQFGEAENVVQQALRLEQEWPIENWGSRLSRYQGQPRLWVEQLRAALPNSVND